MRLKYQKSFKRSVAVSEKNPNFNHQSVDDVPTTIESTIAERGQLKEAIEQRIIQIENIEQTAAADLEKLNNWLSSVQAQFASPNCDTVKLEKVSRKSTSKSIALMRR